MNDAELWELVRHLPEVPKIVCDERQIEGDAASGSPHVVDPTALHATQEPRIDLGPLPDDPRVARDHDARTDRRVERGNVRDPMRRRVSVQIHRASALVGLRCLAALSLQGGPDGPTYSENYT